MKLPMNRYFFAYTILFFYFDPPYYNKGQKLYKNFFSHKDHQRIHDVIAQEIAAPWIITYDDVGEIARLYADFAIRKFDLTYSAGVSTHQIANSRRLVQRLKFPND